MSVPTLYIFAGLPGAGKTTLSRLLARRITAAHIRIDTVEQSLRELCNMRVEGEGYGLSYRIAADNLKLGTDVVADSCNPIELTRSHWEQVACECGASFVHIEAICSDADEHRRRIESRRSDIPGLVMPTWEDVVNRGYDPWSRDRVVIDTAERSSAECLDVLIASLGV